MDNLNQYFLNLELGKIALPSSQFSQEDEFTMITPPDQTLNRATKSLVGFSFSEFGYIASNLVASEYGVFGRAATKIVACPGSIVAINTTATLGDINLLGVVSSSLTRAGFPVGNVPVMTGGTITTQGQCYILDRLTGAPYDLIVFVPKGTTLELTGISDYRLIEWGNYIYANVTSPDMDYISLAPNRLGGYITKWDGCFHFGHIYTNFLSKSVTYDPDTEVLTVNQDVKAYLHLVMIDRFDQGYVVSEMDIIGNKVLGSNFMPPQLYASAFYGVYPTWRQSAYQYNGINFQQIGKKYVPIINPSDNTRWQDYITINIF